MTYRWVEEEAGWLYGGWRLEREDGAVYAIVRERHPGGPWNVTWPSYDPTPCGDARAAMDIAERMVHLEGQVG